MTTAHRPTWAPAKGGEEQGGTRIFAPSRQFSAKDQAAQTKLKFRCAACPTGREDAQAWVLTAPERLTTVLRAPAGSQAKQQRLTSTNETSGWVWTPRLATRALL